MLTLLKSLGCLSFLGAWQNFNGLSPNTPVSTPQDATLSCYGEISFQQGGTNPEKSPQSMRPVVVTRVILEPCVNLRYLCFEGAAATTATTPSQPVPQGREERKEQINMWTRCLNVCLKQVHQKVVNVCTKTSSDKCLHWLPGLEVNMFWLGMLEWPAIRNRRLTSQFHRRVSALMPLLCRSAGCCPLAVDACQERKRLLKNIEDCPFCSIPTYTYYNKL